jgi:pimeloyl-ACP methyl ester carboxylesterase/putative sterol carrier protein
MSLLLRDRAWWEAYAAELNRDSAWFEAARYFPARIEYRVGGDCAFTLDTRDGRVASVSEGSHPLGADIVIGGPTSEWQRLLDGSTDWFEGMSPGLGQLTLEGNAVAAMRNVKAMWLLLGAMKRVNAAPAAAVQFSPPPLSTGREPVGRYVEVKGVRTYYEEAGAGIPIVCIHAACQDTLMYRYVLGGLSDSYRVISLDAPGHGKTDEPVAGPLRDITRHAEFNEAFMEALGLERPVIIGCSMGGNQVLELAARRPDFYGAVVSSEGADFTPTVSEFLLEMLLLNGPQILECWSQSLTGNRTPPDRAREIVWQIRRVCPEYAAGDLVGYAGFDRREEVKGITSPVLLLRGDADWLVNQQMVEETSGRIPGSRIAVLAGTGHYPMIENPSEFNDAVRAFLADVLG